MNIVGIDIGFKVERDGGRRHKDDYKEKSGAYVPPMIYDTDSRMDVLLTMLNKGLEN